MLQAENTLTKRAAAAAEQPRDCWRMGEAWLMTMTPATRPQVKTITMLQKAPVRTICPRRRSVLPPWVPPVPGDIAA